MKNKLETSYFVQNFGVFLILLSYMKVNGIFGLGLVLGFLPLIYRYCYLKIKPDFLLLLPIKTLRFVLIYIFCIFLSAFMIKDISTSLQETVRILNYTRPFFLILFLANNKKEFYYGALIAIIVAGVQWVFLSQNDLISYFRDNKYANLGPFDNQNIYVFYLNLLIPFMLVNVLNSKISIKIICGIVTIFLLLANLTTISRGGIIAFSFMFLIYMFSILKTYKKRILFTGAFAALTLVLFGFMNFKVIDRIEHTGPTKDLERIVLWQSSIEMIKDNFWFGVGINNFNNEYRTKYISPLAKNANLARSHNMWLTSLAETGIIGTAGLLVLMYHFATFSFRNRNNNGECKFNLAIFLAFSGMFLNSLVDDVWVDQYIRIFWCLWAVAVSEASFCKAKDAISNNDHEVMKR